MQPSSNPQSTTKFQPSCARRQRDGGYLLLAIMLMMALMIIAATVAAPKVVQQIKRDREEEMIHRGVQYARAIKRFYKKNGRYPATLDDLDKGQIKYLRQRYKDPLAKDGKWKLLNYADIATLLNTAAPGTPAAAMGTLGGQQAGQQGAPGSVFSNSASPTPGGFSQSPFGSQQQQQQQQQQQNPGFASGGFPSNSGSGRAWLIRRAFRGRFQRQPDGQRQHDMASGSDARTITASRRGPVTTSRAILSRGARLPERTAAITRRSLAAAPSSAWPV